MGEGEEDVCPVLLEHGVCLVEDEEFDGGEKVAVKVFGTGICKSAWLERLMMMIMGEGLLVVFHCSS